MCLLRTAFTASELLGSSSSGVSVFSLLRNDGLSFVHLIHSMTIKYLFTVLYNIII